MYVYVRACICGVCLLAGQAGGRACRAWMDRGHAGHGWIEGMERAWRACRAWMDRGHGWIEGMERAWRAWMDRGHGEGMEGMQGMEGMDG